MAPGFGEGGLDQLVAEPAMALFIGDVHAEQQRLVSGFFPRLQGQADDADQLLLDKRPQQHIEPTAQA
ncbi:hypothetical protein D3C76_1448720 [compost metagenome]